MGTKRGEPHGANNRRCEDAILNLRQNRSCVRRRKAIQAQANKEVVRPLHGSTIWANSRTIHAPADAGATSGTN